MSEATNAVESEDNAPQIGVASASEIQLQAPPRAQAKSRYPVEDLDVGQLLFVEARDSDEGKKKQINNLRGRVTTLRSKGKLAEGAKFDFGIGTKDGMEIVAVSRTA